jgi:pilus assembly protein Flp/PilA
MDKTNESGQGLVEYAMILILVTLVVIIMLVLFGESVENLFIETVSTI